MAQKEEVLSKVNQICEERNFDLSETFRDKFSEKFAEAYKDAPIEDAGLVAALNISVESSGHARKNAFSEATKGFEAKEAEYKSQIEEWKKKAEKVMMVEKAIKSLRNLSCLPSTKRNLIGWKSLNCKRKRSLFAIRYTIQPSLR